MFKSSAPKVRAEPVLIEAMEPRRLLSGGGSHAAHLRHVAHEAHVKHEAHMQHQVHVEAMKLHGE